MLYSVLENLNLSLGLVWAQPLVLIPEYSRMMEWEWDQELNG